MSAEIRQGEYEEGISYTPSTFGSILALNAARATGLFGIVAILINGYQAFSYDKSSLKRFYIEESDADFSNLNGTNINDLPEDE